MLTVRELADELGVTSYTLAQVVNLYTWEDNATVPDETADRAREMLAGQPEPSDDPMVTAMRQAITEPAPAKAPALDTYEPSPIALTAIDALVRVIGSPLGNTPKAQVSAMFVATAVVLADLVAQGVAPYASAPGELVEADTAASTALTNWVARRASRVAAQELIRLLVKDSGKVDLGAIDITIYRFDI